MGYVNTADTTEMRDLLAPFINNHYLTLQSFRLSSTHNIDTTPFFLQLKYFHLLREIAIPYQFTCTQQRSPDGLQHVLKMHSRTLRSLSFWFRTDRPSVRFVSTQEEWFHPEFFHVILPTLESIVIQMDEFFERDEGIVKYLLQHVDSLTSITLKCSICNLDDLENLVDAFAQCSRLLSLDIHVFVMNPRVVDLLAEKLPNLERLSLKFDLVGPNDSDLPDMDRYHFLSRPHEVSNVQMK